MSEISDSARISVALADYAATDSANKINALGIGWALTRIVPETGQTAPQTVVVTIEVEPRFNGEDYAAEVSLLGSAGDPVQIPGPTGDMQPLRVARNIQADVAVHQGVPNGTLWPRTQFVLSFPNGIPLEPGNLYTWSVSVDGNRNPSWAASFYVVRPPAPPVLG